MGAYRGEKNGLKFVAGLPRETADPSPPQRLSGVGVTAGDRCGARTRFLSADRDRQRSKCRSPSPLRVAHSKLNHLSRHSVMLAPVFYGGAISPPLRTTWRC